MFLNRSVYRYAWCGYGPHSNHFRERASQHDRWRSGRCFSWHSGPVFGVRRPMRYLAYKLDLDEDQVRVLAGILDDLKTARAQADVDWQRSVSDLAGALEEGEFDEGGVRSALERRARSAEQLRGHTLESLRRLHGLLSPQQRRELAYLLRSGGVSF